MKYKWFTAAFLSLCLIPAAGMLVLPEQQAAGNEHLTPKPSLWNAQTGWNADFLGDLTDYIADHFGFRQELVTANAALQTRLLCTSPAEDVIYGTDGWLYYAKTLDDYQNHATLTESEAQQLAQTVKSMQDYCESRGARFLFTIAPNKSSLYPEHMPARYLTEDADGNYEHMVFPGSVYVSQSTEYGTIYSKAELQAIADVAHKYDMPLFVDGARLGYALTATGSDMTLAVFYIGGTKVGALFGEAVVFTKHNTPKHFLTLIKQHGALLAKGFVLGAQFDALFTDNLYFKIARNANEAADRIREALRAKGYTLTFEAPTNQIFVTMDQPTIDRLEREVKLGFTEKADDTHTVMRICTSWATTPEEVDQLIELL